MQEFDGNISINNGAKKIKINDNGDYIILQVNDSTFLRRYAEFFKDIQKVGQEITTELEDDDILKNLEIQEKAQILLAEKFDNFFGKGTCKKAFGTDTPCIDDILNFTMQLSEYVNKYSEERIESINNIQSKFLEKAKARQRI